MIEAIYEDHVFRPLEDPGDLPDHTQVRLSIETHPAGRIEADDEETRIARIESLAQAAFGDMSEEEDAVLKAARLDQWHFFDHSRS